MKRYKSLFEKKKNIAKIVCLGNILLTKDLVEYIDNQPKNFIIEKIKDYLKTANVLHSNVLSLFTTKGGKIETDFDYRIKPKYLSLLKKIGLDSVNVINNNSYNFGQTAFIDSVIKIQSKRLGTVGNLENPVDIVRIKKKDINVGFTGYYLNDIYQSRKDILNEIKLVKAKSEIVIVNLYFLENSSMKKEKDFCEKCIDNGADFILGYSYKDEQKIEEYNDGYLVYSMGNFLTNKNIDKYTSDVNGIVLEIDYDYDEKKIENVEIKHVYINDKFQPEIVEG